MITPPPQAPKQEDNTAGEQIYQVPGIVYFAAQQSTGRACGTGMPDTHYRCSAGMYWTIGLIIV